MSGHLHIGIVVGEASGDILGAALMTELRRHFPNAEFSGIGGPRMLELGFHSYFPQDRLAVMGLIEPLKRLPELLRIRKFLREHFTANPPSVFIGIDSPDFTIPLEGALKEKGIKTVHYVSPSVWAWRQKRIINIARSVDLMLTLLPFEARFYEEHGVPVEFVGHHLADAIPDNVDKTAARQLLGLPGQGRIVALLPGSRSSEVERMAELFFRTAVFCIEQDPSLHFVVPAANSDRYRQLHIELNDFVDFPIHLVNGHSQDAMAAADVLLVASGTVTLEALLLKKPMVVAYKMAPLTYRILSWLVKTPFVSLPNLLAQKMLVPELLQDKATPEALSAAVMNYFENPEQSMAVSQTFADMHRELKCNASARAADAIARLIKPAEAS
ncbi:lipid-A-disaccharide synthase [Cellvibrio japonicus]|uniref:Lipid-A-disaccharide synthase n=1 Tax=Cellvibrio japonicus (strain Ueda107) TaxID=498211 RepID=LPXB_CELJU|nr:lipid-A-disaccharide synthase [Cellvibrio japonicus]B3PBR1.1 RecName: Full=Lipid-A-disaccharide synthase [Cellvibrio japonicus Ueda107]ACE85917.1 lipid-A-disaccharide synthase, putative, lpx19A [Cellvibrio japonicus Ueda107]QEI11732.1 lipid-A-disaccharide synthase [Cellvibrio japonicus]QEI15306.1 lipid-A-disaccharide synthase [Cellvibrio japonicus]QEI18886.1 lipid-A-disaccharide synthase [Cellvibrio japonicus]